MTTRKAEFAARLSCCVLLALAGLCFATRAGAGENQYIGCNACKNCHSAPSTGDPYDVWLKSDHHKAWDSLASDKAKAFGKAKNIADPQKADACVKCHQTAFGLPDAQKAKSFAATINMGVQCESCHGPGGNHRKARLNAAEAPGDKLIEIPKGEMVAVPTEETCKKCHNAESPSFKPFDYKAFVKKIAHLDPRKNHPADWLDKLGTGK